MVLQQRIRRTTRTVRIWIRAWVLVTTCAALTCSSPSGAHVSPVMKAGQQPRIVVVGAGVAGLGAATRLKELGFTDLLLVEASDAVGGRVAKAKIGKTWVDTGAQYVHGASAENPVFCLLKKSGLLSQVPPDEGSSVYYRRDGHQISEDFAERVYEAGEGILRQRGNNSRRSLGEHFAEAAQGVMEGWQAEKKKRVQSLLALVGKDYLVNIAASDLHKVSVDSWQYYIDMGDDLNVEGCMFQMVEKLAKEFPEERLMLNKPVSEIQWNGSFPGTDGQVYPVRLVGADGEEILADHVVVTISLGCLKAQAATLFNPSLPPEKMEVIDKLSFGNIAKIFLEYEEAFWESDVSRISIIWDDDSVVSVSTNKTQWLKHLNLFTVMKPKEKFGNILIGWCPGDVADLIETMTEEELSSAITGHLRVFTGNSNIPPPKRVLHTKWRTNNFTRGSYTYIPVGVDGQVMDVLAQPLVGTKNPHKDLQVLFCGEATMKSLYSTVQGALLSGLREANRLAELYGVTAPPTVYCSTPSL